MKRRGKYRGTRIELLIIFAACMFRIGWEYKLTSDYQRQQEALRAVVEDAAVKASQKQEEAAGDMQADMEREMPVILRKYEKLHEENGDLVGWLTIPGTAIDYPVMQKAGNEYYLHHDFYGEEDKHGCLFVKDIADVDTPGDCFIIYGHNMKDGTMFGDLDEYRSEAYYREHPRLRFDSLYEEREYEIMAVFLSRVYKEGEEGFRYYDFYTADTEEAFRDFYGKFSLRYGCFRILRRHLPDAVYLRLSRGGRQACGGGQTDRLTERKPVIPPAGYPQSESSYLRFAVCGWFRRCGRPDR